MTNPPLFFASSRFHLPKRACDTVFKVVCETARAFVSYWEQKGPCEKTVLFSIPKDTNDSGSIRKRGPYDLLTIVMYLVNVE